MMNSEGGKGNFGSEFWSFQFYASGAFGWACGSSGHHDWDDVKHFGEMFTFKLQWFLGHSDKSLSVYGLPLLGKHSLRSGVTRSFVTVPTKHKVLS